MDGLGSRYDGIWADLRIFGQQFGKSLFSGKKAKNQQFITGCMAELVTMRDKFFRLRLLMG
ncbi:hypothetical protein AWQ21_05470 [Picosynechococcus sp. PCC 7003]|nr:hypothetical protein AWQ21_05470 [Picosynechococcus sp. PCC 7003]